MKSKASAHLREINDAIAAIDRETMWIKVVSASYEVRYKARIDTGNPGDFMQCCVRMSFDEHDTSHPRIEITAQWLYRALVDYLTKTGQGRFVVDPFALAERCKEFEEQHTGLTRFRVLTGNVERDLINRYVDLLTKLVINLDANPMQLLRWQPSNGV